jgi:hypothetical protein
MANIDQRFNPRAKANEVTWTPCMHSLQKLNADIGDQFYRYYQFKKNFIDITDYIFN